MEQWSARPRRCQWIYPWEACCAELLCITCRTACLHSMSRVPSEAGWRPRCLQCRGLQGTWIPTVECVSGFTVCSLYSAELCFSAGCSRCCHRRHLFPRLWRPTGNLGPLPTAPHINSASGSSGDIKHSHTLLNIPTLDRQIQGPPNFTQWYDSSTYELVWEDQMHGSSL